MTALGINLTISAQSQPNAMSFKAFKQGIDTPILMDGQTEILIQPTLTVSPLAANIGTPTKSWYFVTTMVNEGGQDVAVAFDNGTKFTEIVPAHSQKVKQIIVQSTSQPADFKVTASQTSDNQSVMINWVESFVLVSREQPQPTTLVIGKLYTG